VRGVAFGGGGGEDAEAFVPACADRAAAEVGAVGLRTGGVGGLGIRVNEKILEGSRRGLEVEGKGEERKVPEAIGGRIGAWRRLRRWP
jgi:hypothetical protein